MPGSVQSQIGWAIGQPELMGVNSSKWNYTGKREAGVHLLVEYNDFKKFNHK